MPPYFRNLSEREVVSVYLRLGFIRTGRGRGPHERYEHVGLGLTAHIPRHRGTIPQGTVTRMVRLSGVTDEEFLSALDGNIPPRFRN